MSRRAACLAVALAAPGLAGCLFEEPEDGDQIVRVCNPGDSDPGTDVLYTETIRPILLENCLCHQPMNYATPIGFQMTGFNVETYESLRRGGANTGTAVVVPGDPCASFIIRKTSSAPPFGSRMPLFQPGLPVETRQRIHDWIAEGALEN